MKTYKIDLTKSLDEIVNNYTIFEIQEIFYDTILKENIDFSIINNKEKNLHVVSKIMGFHEERKLTVPYRHIVDTREISRDMTRLIEKLLEYNKQILSKFEDVDNFYIDLKNIYYIKICIKED